MHSEQGAVMIYFNGQQIAFRPISNEERGLRKVNLVLLPIRQ